MKKRAIIAILFALLMCLSACGTKETGADPKKTVFARAKELSEYYDKVPASYAELVGEETAENNKGNSGEPQSDVEPASEALNVTPVSAGITQLTPDNRPETINKHIVRDVEEIIAYPKEMAIYARGLFQTYSSLNEWIGGAKADGISYAFRLNYDKQLDRIKVEEYEVNYGLNEIYYDLMYLHLEKDHKINFTWSRYCASRTTQETFIAFRYEYVEDDYYYYVHNTSDSLCEILSIDLKSNPKRVFYSSAIVNATVENFGQPWTKEIILEFDSGEKVIYSESTSPKALDLPEKDSATSIIYCDKERNRLFEMGGSQFFVDLWQTTGWTSVVSPTNDWRQGYTFNTDNKVFQIEAESDWLINEEDNYPWIGLPVEAWEEDLNYVSARINVFNNVEAQNTVQNMKAALTALGLSLKEDYDELFEEYFEDGYEAEISQYDCPKVNFQAMDWEGFKGYLAQTNDGKMQEFLATFDGISVTDSLEAQERKDGSEAYEMLDTTFEGAATVDFDGLTIDFTGFKATVPDSVLHVEGAKYTLKVGLYNGEAFVELAKGETVYNNAAMIIGVPTSAHTLFENLAAETQYTLVAYVCNENGMRCSEFFYPDVSAEGTGEMTFAEGNDNMKVKAEVKNKALTVYKSAKKGGK